ncbi:MAG: DUF2835 domain-containing protein [Paraglaciecola sp.]|jgi:hypothetical protein|nr:DUF2835 domain-containing protein [Paraglaciecola sp.]NCT47875.1 DUF2835 domain-containing protein [Paraglaciecola sp.]
MRTYYFSLQLSYEQCQQLYYAGNNSAVVADESGIRVQVPTKNLRPFVTVTGIKGRFRLIVNEKNKIVSFEKMT